MIRIIHQREKCIGCNYCEELDSYRWQIDKKDGKVLLTDSKEKNGIFIALVSDVEYETVKEASDICPVGIIKFESY